VSQLKKYLYKKLGLNDPDEIEVLCKGEVLGPELSIYFIKCTRWMEGDHDLTLHYRKNAYY
jgi:hypothetical protein